MKALSVNAIRKSFGETVALDGVDLDVEAGTVLAVIGENGAGKSTLLNIVSGALSQDSGSVALARPGIAYIRQELALFPHLTVEENIVMGREPRRFGWVDRDAMSRRASTLLAEFGRAEIDPRSRVGDLPPASRQVVEICRALAADAQVILMDEPTSSLQRADVELLFAAIRKLCARGIAVVYVSHFLEEIREIAPRAVVLRDGKSVWSGELAAISDTSLIGHMVGRAMDPQTAGARSSGGDVVLEVHEILESSLTLRRGEVLGIAGLVGSGRTELIRAIFGLSDVRRGTVTVRSVVRPADTLTAASAIGDGVGYLGEDRNVEGLFPHLTVRQNLTMTRPVEADIARWVERLRIKAPDVDASIRHLSGGNQQKVLLARLLHQGADILLLDEPTRGIDIGSKMEIYAQIRGLASEGKAILIVSSYLPELFKLCDRLAVMSKGRLTDARPIAEWTPDSVLEAAIGSGAAA